MVESKNIHKDNSQRERGIALIVALLVTVIMTLLGVPFLLMGETENRIAENERLSQQALYAADAGAKMAVRWFNRPMNANNLANPTLAILDRTQRLINADGDPSTAPVAANGTIIKPYYKQGIDTDADGNDDVFMKPYRPSMQDSLIGTEAGPDIVIDETANAATMTFLTNLSEGLLSGYPAAGAGVKARISRIDIYEPPWVNKGGTWYRFGVGTIKAVAKIFKELADGSEEVLSERMVKLVMNEIPYNRGDLGPLHSCQSIGWNGDFSVHWGITTAVTTADLHNNHSNLPVSLPRDVPPSPRIDQLYASGNTVADLNNWNAYYRDIIEEDGYMIEDPWLRFMAGGALDEASSAPLPGNSQPWPFTWVPGLAPEPIRDMEIPYHANAPGPDPSPVGSGWDGTHSNYIHLTPPGCPSFPYELWKGIAQAGGLNVHYYEYDNASDCFRKPGSASCNSFRDITDGTNGGLYFFDTADGQAPLDTNGDGVPDNLTDPIQISGGTWGSKGMIYLNASEFVTTGVKGRDVTFNAPGEPYADSNQNGRYDAGERWVNLNYPNQLKPSGPMQGRFFAAKKLPPTLQREARGPDITDEANHWGIFYTAGYYDARGNGVYYGTMVSELGIADLGPTAGTPDHYWDESIKTNWPPDDWGLPLVHVSSWETDL